MFTKWPRFELKSLFFIMVLSCSRAESKCRGCDLALASYKIYEGATLIAIARYFDTSVKRVQSFNPQITQKDIIKIGTRINVPFSCDCIELDHQVFLGHIFSYKVISRDTYGKIAEKYYANLSTARWVRKFNAYDDNHIPDVNIRLNVTVNCSCGEKNVDKNFGLFVTYPLQPGENMSSIAKESGIPQELLQRYNPDKDFSGGSGLVFIPGRDQSGNFPPLHNTAGISSWVIASISVAGVVGALLLSFGIYVGQYRRKKVGEVEGFLPEGSPDQYVPHRPGSGHKNPGSAALVASPGCTGITVDKSVEFTYKELAKATNDFSVHNKIGQGGFGSVYYAEIRGEKAAIKKMDMKASKEFLAELKVLTHVHHVNVVRLIGYCVEGSLLLVYEFIQNGTLSQHLHGSAKDPLSWSTRLQIALDSARGLEYIHEHTVPVYIHRDIKSSNILVDENFHGKVADFGLTKLTDQFGSASLQSRAMGTFGYMPPEYVRFGEISPKTDVYAFGVVLYELISAQQAIIKTNELVAESTGIIALFQNVLNLPDPREKLLKLIDPRLGDDYPLDSVYEMARLANACTQGNRRLRPNMRSIVVALTTLSSSTADWDIATLYENQDLVNLMSGR